MSSREKILRQRGWSIHSEATQTTHNQSDEDEPTAAEKAALLESMPSGDQHDEDDDDHLVSTTAVSKTPTKKKASIHEDETPMVSNKKRGRDAETDAGAGDGEPAAKKGRRLFDTAKTRLSKWAARLFDPDRPRGTIQTPEIIPLNDEFLQAFGKREKAHDAEMGVELEIDRRIKDEDVDNDEEEQLKEIADETDNTKRPPQSTVKLTNLKFTTTKATLEVVCQKYGPIERVHLVMDKNNSNLNSGRAYVTFANAEAAQACLAGLLELEGRKLRNSLADDLVSSGGGSSKLTTARYWMEDIGTKCFRCGKTGHMEADCQEEAKPKPCPLCAAFDHGVRECPNKAICFKCGLPGHVSRYCNRQNAGPRLICTICLESGHAAHSCRSRGLGSAAHQAAVCMSCGQTGHYLCRDLKWFFGLQGVSCGNCGLPDHVGRQCNRPDWERLFRNDELLAQEVERASTFTTSLPQAPRNESSRGGRGRETDRGQADPRQRAKSMPPPGRGYQGGRRQQGPPTQQPQFQQHQKQRRGYQHSPPRRGRR